MKRRGRTALSEQLRYSSGAVRKADKERNVQTWLPLTRGNKAVLPSKLGREDVRFSDSLVQHFLNEFTASGQIVLDPFAGFGTTLLVAQEMGRVGYGVEYDEAKVDYVRGLLEHPERMIHGDSRKLHEYDLPRFDLCLTSPPYTNIGDDENPFADYSEKGFDYPSYLEELGRIFSQVARLMNPAAHVVIEIANLKKRGRITTLAWDAARQVSQVLRFEGEVVIGWDKYGYGYNHSYCLVFSKP